MVTRAAIFDLDRTLMLGGSGPMLMSALSSQGIGLGSASAVADFAFATYDLVGETLPSVMLTKQGVRRARGWPVEAVRQAAEEVAPELADKVEPYALAAIEKHRADGCKLVMATASPYDLVRPLSDRLGFDDLIATRHRVMEDPEHGEVYAGEVDGEFVWGAGKARSVEVWAQANLVSLHDCYAYTDSFYDLPLLRQVGYPVAVNPDPRLLAVATYKGWPRRWFNAPPGIPKPMGVEPQDLAARLAAEPMLPWLKLEVDGLEKLPAGGGALLVYNRASRFDPYALALAVRRAGRPIRMLDQRQERRSGQRGVGPWARAFGFLGLTDASAVAGALKAGELVAAPSGTEAEGHCVEAVAHKVDVPVVHVNLEGTQAVWPDGTRFPFVMNLSNPPTVRVEFR